MERLAKVGDEDFSEFGFHETFTYLTRGTSIRGVAAKTGLGKSYIQRLLQGDADPSYAVMEQIAKAYKKHPSFFLEYRIAHTLVILDDFLRSSPETATSWYLKLGRAVN